MRNVLLLSLTLLFTDCLPVFAAEPDYGGSVKSFRETLRLLVEAKTVNPPGDERKAVNILAARLKKEGIPYQTMDFGPNRTNLVARLKGNGEKKPLLLLAHIDVVGTDNQKWTYPPHKLTEKDGYLYGRGVQDDLGMAVSNLETFIALKRLKVPLKRDVILAFTGDEESGGLGIQELLKKHPDWINAEIGLNEGGGITNDENTGKVRFLSLTSAEKIYQDFVLTTKGTTGHSSLPKKDNAIGVLSQALDRLHKYQPKVRLLPVTREYFRKRAGVEPPELAKAMGEIANATGELPKNAVEVLMNTPTSGIQLFTTCIPTMVTGGSRVNALPPSATANINCRILPDEDVPTVKKRLIEIINDPNVEVSLAATEFGVGGASPVTGAVPAAVEKVAQSMWPNVPVIPYMVSGATDSRFLRNEGMQIYGISPIVRTEKDITRAHGIDERLAIASIRPALEFSYKLVFELAAN